VVAGKPKAVLAEVHRILGGILEENDFVRLDHVFADVELLFSGMYPGYSECNTRYHDLEHTTDTLLAMARLIHGAFESGRIIDRRIVLLGLVAALLHDTGYIQTIDDRAGTGAKYTSSHIFRSINFAKDYLLSRGYARADYSVCRNALLCTGINSRVDMIAFRTEDDALIGKMLGTSDLFGQMASSRYLEKLPHLHQELVEGGVVDRGSEYEFLENTEAFYRSTLERFANDLGGAYGYMQEHFRARWGIDRDLYLEAIEDNIEYLGSVLRSHPEDYLRLLKRKKTDRDPACGLAHEAVRAGSSG
jgi:hypothetical protein